jgi:hypothetical protein
MIKRRRKCRACGHRMTTVEVSSELIDELPELIHGMLDANANITRHLTALITVNSDLLKRMP